MAGIWKIFASFSYRPAQGWLAILASGVIGLILGAVIWQQWPLSALWVVGTLAGINLLSTGISFIVLAMSIRRFKQAAREVVLSGGVTLALELALVTDPQTLLKGRPLMIEELQSPNAHTLGFKLSGKLHDEDYKTFVPRVDQAIADDGKVRLLAWFHDFQGWDAHAHVGRHQVLDHALHEDRTHRPRG